MPKLIAIKMSLRKHCSRILAEVKVHQVLFKDYLAVLMQEPALVLVLWHEVQQILVSDLAIQAQTLIRVLGSVHLVVAVGWLVIQRPL